MEIYKYRIISSNITITLRAKGPNSSGKITYGGDSFSKKLVILKLSGTSGAFGHSFYPLSSTPIDLDFVLKQTFGKEDIEVLGEVITSYDPEIPEGAMT